MISFVNIFNIKLKKEVFMANLANSVQTRGSNHNLFSIPDEIVSGTLFEMLTPRDIATCAHLGRGWSVILPVAFLEQRKHQLIALAEAVLAAGSVRDQFLRLSLAEHNRVKLGNWESFDEKMGEIINRHFPRGPQGGDYWIVVRHVATAPWLQGSIGKYFNLFARAFDEETKKIFYRNLELGFWGLYASRTFAEPTKTRSIYEGYYKEAALRSQGWARLIVNWDEERRDQYLMENNLFMLENILADQTTRDRYWLMTGMALLLNELREGNEQKRTLKYLSQIQVFYPGLILEIISHLIKFDSKEQKDQFHFQLAVFFMAEAVRAIYAGNRDKNSVLMQYFDEALLGLTPHANMVQDTIRSLNRTNLSKIENNCCLTIFTEFFYQKEEEGLGPQCLQISYEHFLQLRDNTPFYRDESVQAVCANLIQLLFERRQLSQACEVALKGFQFGHSQDQLVNQLADACLQEGDQETRQKLLSLPILG